MDLLKAELARKKNDLAQLRSEIARDSANGSSSSSGNSSRFLRQSDIQELQQKRHQKQEADTNNNNNNNNNSSSSSSLKRQRLDSDRDDNRNDDINNNNNNNDKDNSNDSKQQQQQQQHQEQQQQQQQAAAATTEFRDLSKLNINQINQRFRKIGEPIIMFGETLTDRINRLTVALTKYYNQEGRDEDRTRTGNLYKDKDNTDSSKSKLLLSNKNDINNDDSDDDNSRADENKDKKDRKYDPTIKYSEMENLSKEMIVYKYFKSILKAWARNLDARPENEKTTAKGKMDTTTQKQCKDYVRPLFKMCKKKNVPADILMKLEEMVQFCENGDFRSANDKYLRAAIGNAAWPMGLNGVSIHQRAAQDNVGKSNIAHVMNNEIQRKYLTSVKRLMTYAQDLRPDVPPSMKVL